MAATLARASRCAATAGCCCGGGGGPAAAQLQASAAELRTIWMIGASLSSGMCSMSTADASHDCGGCLRGSSSRGVGIITGACTPSRLRLRGLRTRNARPHLQLLLQLVVRLLHLWQELFHARQHCGSSGASSGQQAALCCCGRAQQRNPVCTTRAAHGAAARTRAGGQCSDVGLGLAAGGRAQQQLPLCRASGGSSGARSSSSSSRAHVRRRRAGAARTAAPATAGPQPRRCPPNLAG